jgi:hypothetical protein
MKEEDRTRQIIIDMAKGEDSAHKLKFDPLTRKIRPVSIFHDPDDWTGMTAEDATLSSLK